MLMRAIAHGGCADTAKECALEADPREKSLAAPGTRTRVSTAPVFSIGHSTDWALLILWLSRHLLLWTPHLEFTPTRP